MKKPFLILSFVLVSLNVLSQDIYNRYGFLLKRDGDTYALAEENEIRKQATFDLDKAPCDMYQPFENTGNFIAWTELEKCTTKTFVYKKYPNYELKLEVDLPKREGCFPFIVWIHGGGWHSGDFYGHKSFSTYLASNGIAGVRISYSLMTQGARFEDTWQDIQDAVSFIKEHAKELKLDTSNFGFAGHSAGGHLSSYAAMRTEGCKLLVSFNGIYDIANVVQGYVPSSEHDSYFGKSLKEKEYASPVNYVHRKAPFCMLTYSSGDYLIDKYQVERFEQALKKNDVQYKTIRKDYYSHAGFLGTDLYEPMMLETLKLARDILSKQ